MVSRGLLVLVLASTIPAGSSSPLPAFTRAQGGACTEACRAEHNQCRLQTKGSPRCDAQFAACMQRCIEARGK